MGFLPSCNCVSTTVWMHHLDAKEMYWQNKIDGKCAGLLRAVWNNFWERHTKKHQLYDPLPPISHSIYVKRIIHTGHCWWSIDEFIHKRRSPMDSNTRTHQGWPTSKDLRTSNLCRHWMQSRGPEKSDGWQWRMARKKERKGGEREREKERE